ncbi:DNA polymerase III subunit gamma/tau [Lentibacillus saliphilus]|uniref:DNA polymerase III subunit gamma/tau n=1 Tax=Lentibacillus saliphilus TaxID=2737028 RepID=UPI001C2FC172|nr:DNA polymerase III subunit gamma/tau [Lentibacillus saliphilus]
MSYQALYRTWRPRTFKDVVGQTHITRTLQNAITQQKFSHAYVFSGPRGTGKTSAAKIFAQTINCEQAPTEEPCNECAACRGILDGSISDVIEMDAASHTSVEDIRDIRDKVKYAASSVPYKVYIIDEVHMISTSAFNALLKTLEEPPKHVVFILATTEPHKIPLTILSRCQRFDFKPIPNKAMVERMQYITEAEAIDAANDALEAIALAAEGGMRDALSILDQAVSFSDGHVGMDEVLAVTGGVAQHILTDVVKAMHDGDVNAALTLLDDVIQHGKDPGRFVFDMIYYLRDVLLYKSAPTLEGMLERAVVNDAFKALTETVQVQWLQEAMMTLNECQQELKWTNSPKVFIEMALLTITNRLSQEKTPTQAVDSTELQALQDKLARLEQQLEKVQQAPPQGQSSGTPTPERRRQPARQNKNGYKVPYERIRHVLSEATKPNLKDVHGKWASFLNNLKTRSAPAHATIQDSKPAAASDESLVVAFKYEIHCSLFLDNRQTVETVLAQELGKQMEIIPIPAHEWQELRNEYIKGQEQATTEETDQQKDPLIEEARKLVGDDLLHIHD